MEAMLERQSRIIDSIKRLIKNFKKDSAHRKTSDYLRVRLVTLQSLWEEFDSNDTLLCQEEDKSDEYFTDAQYEQTKKLYENGYQLIQKTDPYVQPTENNEGSSGDESDAGPSGTKNTNNNMGSSSKTDEMLSQQKTNFRALSRVMTNINVENLIEKWEIEDKLQVLQSRWKTIDELHWQIDNLLEGTNEKYEKIFSEQEKVYEKTKSDLHRKLNNVKHQQESTPHIELPTFSGNYTNWPAFSDLYCEAIHNNPTLNKSQKMQHLKGKLKGEAERLVQHLNISAENYDSCWDILNRRYNNQQLLFTKQIQVFMNQPTMQKHTAYEIKRLHDVSLETVHAIQNLGVDTSTWDPILVHIMTEKMDSETYTAYTDARSEKRKLPAFDELISILENKFTALEPLNKKGKQVKQNSTSVKENEPKHRDNVSDTRFKLEKTYKTYAERMCPLCKNTDHVLLTCKKFLNMTPNAKVNTIRTLALCKNCLFFHKYNCTSTKTCKICNNKHHTVLHEGLLDTVEPNNEPQPSTSKPSIPTPRKTNHVAGNYDEVLLSTVELKVRARDGTFVTMRCLLDQGSQINLITESAAQRLELERCNQSSSVFGVGSTAAQSNGAVQLICESRYNNYTFITNALVMPKVIGNLPNFTFEKQPWSHITNISLADPDYNIARPVDILLDAKVYAEILMDGILRGPASAPIAQATKLGWILVGNVKTFNCHAVLNNLDEISQYWEMEEITQSNSNMTPADEYCETLYQATTTRKPDGRYEVRLPMKPNYKEHLAPSKIQAVAQLKQLEKRFVRDEKLSESYKTFIAEYLQLGHMKLCTTQREPNCFLPHHGVIKLDSSTTKLRTVFNASSKLKTGYSLNELMECGPNLQQDIQAMILQWRTFKYVYTADIEKFYRQILVCEEDQHLQKIVWRESPSNSIQEYQLCTVTYGTKAAPYLAMRTIKQLAQDDGHEYPLAVNNLNNQFYVDDLLGGSNNIEEAKDAQQQTINILRGGGFKLRKWASNDARLLEQLSDDLISQNMLDFKHAETNKTLGLSWNPRSDQFTFASPVPTTDKAETTTKRTLLSKISKIFDPLGWLSPVTIKGKLIFQKVWALNLSWDDELPQDIQQEWAMLANDLHNIPEIEISRWIGDTDQPIELHGFCDASERAYGCVIYCKSVGNYEKPDIKIVAGKTKLSPLNKPMSLPRLELCGALLLARLIKKVIDATNIQTRTTVTIHGWTDSMVVLGWLQGDIGRWKTFVAQRIAAIQDTMPPSCWKHVKSEQNPADCASRGLTPSQLLTHELWWDGPEWLRSNSTPQQPTTTNIKLPEEESKTKKVCVTTDTTKNSTIQALLDRHSSMERAIRVLAWVSRFLHNSRHRDNKRTSSLQANEIRNAHNVIIKAVQMEHYNNEIKQLETNNKVQRKSQLLNLNPWIDDEGILRVGGRLGNSDLSDQRKHPMILPNNDRLSLLLITWAHNKTLHGGARLTLTYLRTKYWMLGGMNTVKRELQKCVKCLRFKALSKNQRMADLPKPRVTPSRPFTHTGVDLAGPVVVKSNRGRGIATSKGYVTIFICLATKAVHLELVSDLSSITFLAAFKRLCARRGMPKHMYSDCGTNFVGAARSLQQEHEQALEHYLSSSELMADLTNNGVEWHFNAPSWPTAGGLWEAAVRLMKHHLRRVLGEQKLTFEEFTTLLTQIEACLNSRPLVSLTNSIEDLDCLTPGHFLIGDKTLAPPINKGVELISLGTRWKLTEKMYKDFWREWSMEYLQSLQARSKWHYVGKDLQLGDLVIIKDDHTPPARWLLGRVLQTHPGNDGHVRVVTLKTKNCNEVKRPVGKLIRLPVEQNVPAQQQIERTEQAETSNKNEEQQTRRITTRNHYNFVNIFFVLLTILCTTTIATATQTSRMTETATLNPNQPLYFDKVADMRLIRDEWRMIVYYNLSTYRHSLANIQFHVDRLNELNKEEPAFRTLTTQLQHEIIELQHYDMMLKAEHGKRTKRGLINGIGYIANSLFGVLDERYAERYDEYIKNIQDNENHLSELYKQHTSIIESQYNIVKRNEEMMIKQFGSISKQMADLYGFVHEDHKKSMYVTAAILTANLIINNLRRLQEQLLDLVTDVRSGRMDTHLLKPDEFKNQLNIISANIPDDVTLPCVSSQQDCVREMYKISRVHVRLTDFLMFEVKLPLIHSEPFELNRVIPIPRVTQQTSTYIETSAKYSAINLKKDMIIPISEHEIHTGCITFKETDLLCRLNLPVHTTTRELSVLCEAQIINNKNLSNCGSVSQRCRDEWILLHSRAKWLYTCCQECAVRIFCPDTTVTTKTLRGTGIVKIWPGCMLRGDNINIHSSKTYRSELTINEQETYISESSVNNILSEINFTYVPESHQYQFNILQRQINNVKATQDNMHTLSLTHDTHHYSVYGVIGISSLLAIGIYALCKLRKRRQRNKDINVGQNVELQRIRQPVSTEEPQAAARTIVQQSTRRVNKQTSP